MTRRLRALIVGLLALPALAQAQPKREEPSAGPALLPGMSSTSAELCAPEKMVALTIRNVSPGLAAAHPAAQGRTFYRQGSIFLRSEDQPDMTNGGQMVVIIAEPEVWQINMAVRAGRHARDPGPDFVAHAPILPVGPELPATFRTLEFGCEWEFLTRYGQKDPRQLAWGATAATLYTVTEGPNALAVLMDEPRKAPLMLTYARGGRPVFALRYESYRRDLPMRPELFTPGPGIKIIDTGPDAPIQLPSN